MDFIQHIWILKSEKEVGFMRRIIDTLSMKEKKKHTEKYSINQVFTGRKCPLGITPKYNYVMSIR